VSNLPKNDSKSQHSTAKLLRLRGSGINAKSMVVMEVGSLYTKGDIEENLYSSYFVIFNSMFT